MGDLLEYSKVGSVDLPPEEFGLIDIIQDTIQFLMPKSGMEIHIVGDLPIIKTSKAPLETVIRNVIGNSLKHHDKEKGKITIKADPEPDGISISVTDDGPGILPEFHDRVFQLFQTLKPRDVCEGSEIGLAIVRRTLDTRGGRIAINSDVGRGTELSFTWPCEAIWPEHSEQQALIKETRENSQDQI